jgi:hypothetical protein
MQISPNIVSVLGPKQVLREWGLSRAIRRVLKISDLESDKPNKSLEQRVRFLQTMIIYLLAIQQNLTR